MVDQLAKVTALRHEWMGGPAWALVFETAFVLALRSRSQQKKQLPNLIRPLGTVFWKFLCSQRRFYTMGRVVAIVLTLKLPPKQKVDKVKVWQ